MTATSPTRRLPNLSPSAYNNYTDCQRKWWFDKVKGLRAPPSPSLIVGKAVHDEIEVFLVNGEWGPQRNLDVGGSRFNITGIARAGEEHLWPLREGVVHRDGKVELSYRLPAGQLGPLPVSCQVDYIEPYHVTDHKSTGNLYGPWHKTETQLARDPQMLWYAYMGLREDAPEHFEMQHIYYQTKGAAASRAMRVHATWDDALRNRDRFIEAANDMVRLLGIDDVHYVEGNPDACGKYGGCPFITRCPVNKRAQRSDIVGFRDKILKAKQAEATKTDGAAAGQMNPSDTPGAQHITKAMLEEVATEAFDTLDDPTDDEVREWLDDEQLGQPVLLRVGMGVRHIDRVIAFINDKDQGDDPAKAKAEAAEQAAKAAAEEAAKAKEAKQASTEDVRIRMSSLLLDTLQEKYANGKKMTKKGVKILLRQVSGRTRIDDTIWNDIMMGPEGVFAKGAEAGFWDYSADDKGMVWLITESDDVEVSSNGDGTYTATSKTTDLRNVDLASKAVELSSPVGRPSMEPNQWAGLVICIDCLPSGTVPTLQIDQVLEPYYEMAAIGAGDTPAESFDQVEYGKGPPHVANNVATDVREGRMAPLAGFMFVPAQHPMTSRLARMWPQATFIRGVR